MEASVPTSVHVVSSDSTQDTNHSLAAPNTPSSVTISLTEQEERVFQIFSETAKAFATGTITLPNNNNDGNNSKNCQTITVRVAGGWVRDKLLGRGSQDVDVTMDILTGVQFATLVQEYLKHQQTQQQTHGGETRHRSSKNKKQRTIPKMGVIAANPSQSKHLETATMRVEGIECDFCNLRAQEVYSEDSRIPTTVFGTPLDDALRRDFRLNALFFNLMTRRVEDWTRHGLHDLLVDKTVVTPLDPFITFHDDPLRVLRAIRFAVRLGYQMDDRLQQACASPQVQDCLRVKVSRERVGKELEGMLSGKDARPIAALQTIGRLSLSTSVFSLPDCEMNGNLCINCGSSGNTVTPFEPHNNIEAGWQESQRLLTILQPPIEQSAASGRGGGVGGSSVVGAAAATATTSKFDLRLWVLAVYLLPFRELSYVDQKDKTHLAVEYVVREAIKFKNKDVLAIVTIMETIGEYCLALQGLDDVTRLKAGLLLRTSKDLWVTSIWVAAALVQSQDEGRKNWSTSAMALYDKIVSMGLDLCWKARPLLDGRALIEGLSLPKGPVVRVYVEEQVKWTLANPNGSVDDCMRHLRAFQECLSANNEAS